MPRNYIWYGWWSSAIRQAWNFSVYPTGRHRISAVPRCNPVPGMQWISCTRLYHLCWTRARTSNGWPFSLKDSNLILQALSGHLWNHRWPPLHSVWTEPKSLAVNGEVSGIFHLNIYAGEYVSIPLHHLHGGQCVCNGRGTPGRLSCNWDKGILCCQIKIYCPVWW